MDDPIELRIPVEPISLHAQVDLLDGPIQDTTNSSNSNSEERFNVLELPPVDEVTFSYRKAYNISCR